MPQGPKPGDQAVTEPLPLLDPKMVARRLGISYQTLMDKVKEGHFPRPIKISERVQRWRPEVIEDWLASRIG